MKRKAVIKFRIAEIMNDDSRLDHNRYKPSKIYLFCWDYMMNIMRKASDEKFKERSVNAILLPGCNHKSLTEKDEKEHAKTHQKPAPGQQIEPGVKKIEPGGKKPEEQKKESKIPNIIMKFLHKKVSIILINGSKISGELTEFNNYDMILDNKIMIPKHAMLIMQEVETKT